MNQVFLLSPARCDGERARVLLNPSATFALAERLRSAEGVPLGEVFSFLSGLYFRGKLAYAGAFGCRPRKEPSTFVITTDRGLVEPAAPVTRGDVLRFATVDIGAANRAYLDPLERSVETLAESIGARTRVILLGSIATGKYVDMLVAAFGKRLLFPSEFVGRGDMSRGGLLLRRVRDGAELEYEPVLGAVRHGKRPPRLERIQ
ncbi:MAG TPA: hypothetical protein VH277_05825 [Gemmatimonadaceae bacterium]|jgi:hypothetical protein|nr:hypothetical protein [Gemmatimonadaceae bacterium]